MSSPKRLYWISFKASMPKAVIEGDLVADSQDGLTRQFLEGVKAEITASIIKQNGGNLIPNLGQPIILACIPLDEYSSPVPVTSAMPLADRVCETCGSLEKSLSSWPCCKCDANNSLWHPKGMPPRSVAELLPTAVD